MKKLVVVSLTMAAISAYLLVKDRETQSEQSIESHPENPLHIFRGQSSDAKAEKVRSEKLTLVKNKSFRAAKKVARKSAKKVEPVNAAVKNDDAAISWQKTITKKTAEKAKTNSAPKKQSKNDPWVKELSGSEANVALARRAKEKEKCETAECVGDRRSINLVGVVVETERFSVKSESLVAGDFHIGDAKKLPVLYVK